MNLEDCDFINSDHCAECDGTGVILYQWEGASSPYQCEECERLHNIEIRADRYEDLAKGN